MRFLAKVALLCNLCFLISIVMRLVEISKKVKPGNTNGSLEFNPFISTIVVLGWIAIFINLFFVILFVVRFASRKMNNIPRWIVYFNMILLPMQIYYYFFSKF